MFARFLIMIAVVLTSVAAVGETPRPYGEGLPLPWPFPWAKECPVRWMDLTGRYVLVNSERSEIISLRISVVSEYGLRVLRISRFDHYGHMLADGVTFLTDDQKAVRVHLWPMNPASEPMWANLRLYYRDNGFSCAVDRLVPILSIIRQKANITTEIQYRLLRL